MKDGGAAYPKTCCPENSSNKCKLDNHGMTLRQWYVGKALQGILAANLQPMSDTPKYGRGLGGDPITISQRCYELADAMIAQGEKEK